ncbi:DUF454 family protein [Chthonobacter rhizosphaerae]|uniref:DUF454 family protein n=1 Tax=Chthonobacter rhizosphaerae TaxID=2735553 RepID=UPI0015EE5DCB
MRLLYLAAGYVFLGLGILGAFLPLLPTTIFLILAAAAFARSSPKLEARLLADKRFGPPLRRWRERGAIAPTAKLMALGGMAAGYLLFALTTRPALPMAGVVAIVMLGCAVYVVSRPNA